MKLEHIVIHHYGGNANDIYAKTGDVQFSTIDRAHYQRWPDFKSRLGFWVGYNFIINKDGTWKQARLVGEETAAQKGYNKNAISICLAGNFSLAPNGRPVEIPTDAQKKTLVDMISALVEGRWHAFGIQLDQNAILALDYRRMYPHRYYQQGTDCYGTYLDTLWVRRLMATYLDTRIGLLSTLLQTVADLYSKFYNMRKSLGAKAGLCERMDVRG